MSNYFWSANGIYQKKNIIEFLTPGFSATNDNGLCLDVLCIQKILRLCLYCFIFLNRCGKTTSYYFLLLMIINFSLLMYFGIISDH